MKQQHFMLIGVKYKRFTDAWLSITAEVAQEQPVAEVWDKVCRTHMTACKSGFSVGKEFTHLENT